MCIFGICLLISSDSIACMIYSVFVSVCCSFAYSHLYYCLKSMTVHHILQKTIVVKWAYVFITKLLNVYFLAQATLTTMSVALAATASSMRIFVS